MTSRTVTLTLSGYDGNGMARVEQITIVVKPWYERAWFRVKCWFGFGPFKKISSIHARDPDPPFTTGVIAPSIRIPRSLFDSIPEWYGTHGQ